MSATPDLTEAERQAYDDERAYWLRHADDHFDEGDLPFIRWHQQRVIENFAIPTDEWVMEIGCGSGKLLSHHRHVIAVDFSPEILRKVKEAFPHYDVVCASASALPFRDGAIPAALANNMLHHVKGEGLLDAASAELKRVISPAGRLLVNDRNPCLVHHLIIVVTMSAKKLLRAVFGEFGGCGSFHEPLFTRRDWARIGRHFDFTSSVHYYTAPMWLVDSIAKGLAVVLRRRDRALVRRMQTRALPWLLALERRARWRWWCIEQSVIGRPRNN